MAERVQHVVYRIVVDSSGLAAQLAKVRAEISALTKDDNAFTKNAIKNAEAIEKARKKAGGASRGGDGGSSAVPASGSGNDQQLEAILRQLQKCCNSMGGQERSAGTTRDRASSRAAADEEKLQALREKAAADQLIREERMLQAAANRGAAEARAGRDVANHAAAEERLGRAQAQRRAADHTATAQELINDERMTQAAVNRSAAEQRALAATSNRLIAEQRLQQSATNRQLAERRLQDAADRSAVDAETRQERLDQLQMTGADRAVAREEALTRSRIQTANAATRAANAEVNLERSRLALAQAQARADARGPGRVDRDELRRRSAQDTLARDDRFINTLARQIRLASQTVPGYQSVAVPRDPMHRFDVNQMPASARAALRDQLLTEREAILAAHEHGRARDDLSRALQRSVRALRDNTDATRHDADANRSTPRTLGQRVSGAASGAGNMLGTLLDDAGDAAQKKWRYWQILLAAIGTAVVALIPLIASLTAVLGAFLSTATAAFGAIGVFAIAAVGNIKRLTDALKEARETGMPLKAEFQEVGAAFERLRDTWTGFQRATSEPVFEVFTRALDLANKLLPRFVGLVTLAGAGLEQALRILEVGFDGDQFQQFLEFLGRQGPEAIADFTDGLTNIAQGIGELAMSFEPFIDWFTDGFVRLTAGFEEWADSLAGSDSFREFMEYAMATGPVVLDTLGDIGSLIIDLGVALEPAGAYLMFLIRAISGMVDAIPMGLLQTFTVVLTTWLSFRGLIAVFRGLGSLFLMLRANVAALTISMYGLAGAENAVARGARTAAVAMRLLQSATVVGLAITAIIGLVSAFSGADDTTRDLAASTQDLTSGQMALADALRESGGVMDENVGKAVALALEQQGLLKAGMEVGVDPKAMVDAYLGGDAAWQKVIDKLKKRRDEYLASIPKPADFDDSGEAWSGKSDWVPDFMEVDPPVRSKEQQDKLDSLNTAVDAAEAEAGAVDKVTASNDRMAAATRSSNAAMDAQAAAAERLRDKLDSLAKKTPEMERMDAALSARQKYLDITERVSDAERDYQRLKEDTVTRERDARRAVVDAERAYTEASRRSREATENVTKARERATRQLEDMRDRLRDVALEEEGAEISLARARENIERVMNDPGASDLDRRQAVLDLKRAENEYQDTLENGEITRREAAEAERKGVEGSDEVRQALRDQEAASIDLQRASDSLKDSKKNLNRVLQDNKEALSDAATELSNLRGEAIDAKAEMDVLATTAGTVASNLDAVKLKHQELRAEMAGALSSVPLDDLQKRLDTILTYKRAEQLIAMNPRLTVAQALDQAKKEMAPKTAPPQNFNFSDKNVYMPSSGGGGRNMFNAAGGPIKGAGHGTSDDVPAGLLGTNQQYWLSVGEHVWTAAETAAIGGHKMLEGIRAAVRNGRFNQADAAAFLGAAARGLNGAGRTAVPGVMANAGIQSTPFSDVFNPSSLYAGLDANARYASLPSSVPSSAAGALSNITNSGFSTGDIHIHNPVREPAGDSLYRSVRKLAFESEKN